MFQIGISVLFKNQLFIYLYPKIAPFPHFSNRKPISILITLDMDLQYSYLTYVYRNNNVFAKFKIVDTI